MHSPFYKVFASGLLALALSACDKPASTAAQHINAIRSEAPQSAVTRDLASKLIGPLHQHWLSGTQAMHGGVSGFCSGDGMLDNARQGFSQAQEAFASVQAVALGPLLENNLVWRVQFWPDKKNLVGRQVEQLLKANKAPDVAALEKASVVVQGLSAAEYILYDPAIDLAQAEVKARYCPLLTSIAQRQQALAEQVNTQLAAKGGLLEEFARFPNGRYSEPLEAITELLRVDVTAIDSLKKKLGTPLGRLSKGHPQPMQAEYWRSDLGLSSIHATFSAGKAVWQGNQGLGVRDLLQGDEQRALAARIDAAYEEVDSRFADIGKANASGKVTALSLSAELKTEEGRARLNACYDSLNRLHRLHQQELVGALGIALGFNANDGD